MPLGWRGGFNIFGFGEAAQAYLGKDVRDLTLPEAALLAGLVQRPTATNPFVYPEKSKARRNIVLRLMRDNEYIVDQQYATAMATEIRTVRGNGDTADVHHPKYNFNDDAIPHGASYWAELVETRMPAA